MSILSLVAVLDKVLSSALSRLGSWEARDLRDKLSTAKGFQLQQEAQAEPGLLHLE